MSEMQHAIKTILSLQSLEYQMLEFLFVPIYMCILQLFNLRQFFSMGSILFKQLFSNSFYPCILSCLVSGIISCVLAQIQSICHSNCFSELPEFTFIIKLGKFMWWYSYVQLRAKVQRETTVIRYHWILWKDSGSRRSMKIP